MADLICQHDVTAILELRAGDNNPVSELNDFLNRECKKYRYGYRLSERDGSSTSKEQTVFFYRLDTIHVVDAYSPKAKGMERAPYVGVFKSLADKKFQFMYMSVHIKPTEVVKEMNIVNTLYKRAIENYKNDISSAFIMGDTNADCNYVTLEGWNEMRLRKSPHMKWLIPDGIKTNTALSRDCTYDRIIMDEVFLPSYKEASAGVYRLPGGIFGSKIDPGSISDHYPISMKLHAKHFRVKYRDSDKPKKQYKPWNLFQIFGNTVPEPVKKEPVKPIRTKSPIKTEKKEVLPKPKPKKTPTRPPTTKMCLSSSQARSVAVSLVRRKIDRMEIDSESVLYSDESEVETNDEDYTMDSDEEEDEPEKEEIVTLKRSKSSGSVAKSTKTGVSKRRGKKSTDVVWRPSHEDNSDSDDEME